MDIALYGENLLNDIYRVSTIDFGALGFGTAIYNRPRVIGVQAKLGLLIRRRAGEFLRSDVVRWVIMPTDDGAPYVDRRRFPLGETPGALDPRG